jgi:hypothetical protein
LLALSGAGLIVFCLLAVIFQLTDQFKNQMPVRVDRPIPVNHLSIPDRPFPFASGPPPEIGIDNGF